MLVSPTAKTAPKEVDRTDWTSDYAYVFVHGLIGWGDNTLMDSIVSYFGTFSGNLMQYLRSLGLDCHSATLSPCVRAVRAVDGHPDGLRQGAQ